MTLDQLEAVNAIAERGSFRAAAEQLRRSQPALSTTIKSLEEELGLLIFDRTTYRPTLTEAGAVFLGAARAALDAASHAARVGVELGRNKAETKLTVSVDPLVSLWVMEVLAQVCARAPVGVKLVVTSSVFKSSYQALLTGDVDLAIAPCPSDERRVERIALESVTLVGAISRKLVRDEQPTAALLGRTPQIRVYDRSLDAPPDSLLGAAATADEGPQIFVPDHFSKVRMLAAGIGWGRLSQAEFDASEDLVRLEGALSPPVTLELSVLRARGRPLGPVARAIWAAFEHGPQPREVRQR